MQSFKISQQLVNPGALQVCKILQEHDHQAYIVGGCVRDLLLEQIPKDWDITTDANPQQVISIFSKTIPTGLQHGTVTVVLGEGIENQFEVTTFRTEGEYLDGRRPEEVFFVQNVEDDLARRDLTINAIAYDPIYEKIVDPFGGIKDLEIGIIRAVGIPEARFQEDGLRIMRVCRFAARFAYDIHPETFDAMQLSIDTLRKVSKERISDELSKTLMAAYPDYGLKMLDYSGAMQIVCPLLSSNGLRRAGQERCKGELETRLAFMYSNYPLNIIQQELTDLKFSTREIKKATFLLNLYERFDVFRKEDSESAYKSFMSVLKNQSPEPWEAMLEQFIHLLRASHPPFVELLKKYEQVTVLNRKELQINGNDLMDLGIKPGPEIKKILERCYLEVLDHPKNNNIEFLKTFAVKL